MIATEQFTRDVAKVRAVRNARGIRGWQTSESAFDILFPQYADTAAPFEDTCLMLDWSRRVAAEINDSRS